VDLSECYLVVALAEFTGVLEGALMGKALNEKVDGLTEIARGCQSDTPKYRQGPERPTGGSASWGTIVLIYFFALLLYSEGALAARRFSKFPNRILSYYYIRADIFE
jgi:hypothetical protein